MLKYTKTTLKKVEDLFEAQAYTVRYERGNFNSGYCLVEDRKIAVINKFYDTEGRVQILLEILSKTPIEIEKFDEKQAKFYKQIFKQQAKTTEEEAAQEAGN